MPHAAVKAQLTLDQIALVPFQPIASPYNLNLRRGTFSVTGDVKYAPSVRIICLRQAAIDRLQVDYIYPSA